MTKILVALISLIVISATSWGANANELDYNEIGTRAGHVKCIAYDNYGTTIIVKPEGCKVSESYGREVVYFSFKDYVAHKMNYDSKYITIINVEFYYDDDTYETKAAIIIYEVLDLTSEQLAPINKKTGS